MTTITLNGKSFKLTKSRANIVKQLKKLEWFHATDPLLQEELITLPMQGRENHDGFLRFLSQRPSTIADVTVLKLVGLPRANYSLTPIFLVVKKGGEPYPYELVSWRYGPLSGAKGLVFIKNGETITHLIVQKAEKFAVGKLVWDLIGGFIDLNVENVRTLLERVYLEIRQELGLPSLEILHIYDLGRLLIDPGMTNNHPLLFAAVIDGTQALKLSIEPINPDPYELKATTAVFPIGQIPELLRIIDDSYFLSAISRCLAHGILTCEQLVGEKSQEELPIPINS